VGDAHEDYLDVRIERRDRRAIEEAAAGEGRGRERVAWALQADTRESGLDGDNAVT
jgi:hypothetical protein